jgi:hypothetical protein
MLYNFFAIMFVYLIAATGCNKLSGNRGLNQASVPFDGIEKLEQNTDGTWKLSWPKVSIEDVSYKVFQRDSAGKYNFKTPLAENIKTTEFSTENLTLQSSKCFTVKFKSEEIEDKNTKELCTGHRAFGDFEGCKSYKVKNAENLEIHFEWPEQATEIQISRDGIIVFSSANKTQNVFNDAGLNNSRSYLYKCLAKLNGITKEGTTAFNLRTLNKNDLPPFEGCVSATPLNENQIQLKFQWPPAIEGRNLSAMKIYRNGILIDTPTSLAAQSVTDLGLSEGQEVSYTCSAVFDGLEVEGTKTISSETISINPPSFEGIQSVVANGPRSVEVLWAPASSVGAPLAKWEVWGHPGTSFSQASASLMQTLIPTINKTTIGGLGDEISYVFAVRACSKNQECSFGKTAPLPMSGLQTNVRYLDSATSLADRNKVTKQIVLADAGLPQTVGATTAFMDSGKAIVVAPWNTAQGGISKRRLYYKIGANPPLSCASQPLSVGCFEEPLVFSAPAQFPNTWEVLTQLKVFGLTSDTRYVFYVRDEDPTGNTTTNTAFVAVQTGDLVVPNFSAGGTLILGATGSARSTQLQVNFNAILPENTNPTNNQGASQYLVYLTSAPHPTTPTDPCLEETPVKQISALPYAAGDTISVLLSNPSPAISERRNYFACIKARDTAGNISAASTKTPVTPITTEDTTPPLFDGLQTIAYNPENACVQLNWNPSPTTDLGSYRASLWKASAPGTIRNLQIIASPSSNPSTVCFNSTDLSTLGILDNETLHAYVRACDNAAPTFGTENCSNTVAPKNVLIPDTVPPENFVGINALAESLPPANGTMTVSWQGPSNNNWTDYKGFKLYDVPCKRNVSPCTTPTASDMQLLQTCACPVGSCTTMSPYTQCQLSGLEAYKRYNIFVRAFDSIGNLTPIGTNPLALERRSDDITKPSFSSGLTTSWASGPNATCNSAGNGACLSWNSATDNQSTSTPSLDGNTLQYKIYRILGSTLSFDAQGNPIGATLVSTQSALWFKDPSASLSEGVTYKYTVCAVDQATQNNAINNAGQRCDGTVASLTVPDLTAPVISNITLPSVPASLSSPTWNVPFNVSDNQTNSLQVRVYRIVTELSSATVASEADTEIFASVIPVTASVIKVTGGLINETGITDSDKRISYLFTATDGQGNKSTQTRTFEAHFSKPANAVIGTPVTGTVLNSFAQEFIGTCDSTSGTTVSASLNTIQFPYMSPEGTTTSVGKIISSTCTASPPGASTGILSIKTHLREGAHNINLTVTSTKPNGNQRTNVLSYSFNKPCPNGYVGIPGKFASDTNIVGLGASDASASATAWGKNPTQDFCVMRYTAKAELGKLSNYAGEKVYYPLSDQANAGARELYRPVSRAHGLPFANLTQIESVKACAQLNSEYELCDPSTSWNCKPKNADGTEFGYQLLTNTQWQVLAENIALNKSNWSTGIVGSGVLPKGHTDDQQKIDAAKYILGLRGNYDVPVPSPAFDFQQDWAFTTEGNVTPSPWNTAGPTPSADRSQKRTFIAGNGATLWDVSGNVINWVQDLSSSTQESPIINADFMDNSTNNGRFHLPSSTNLLLYWTNLGSYFSNNLGWFSVRNTGVNSGAVARGACFSMNKGGGTCGTTTATYLTDYHGIFGADLSRTPTFRNSTFGFRCGYIPPKTTAENNAPQISNITRKWRDGAVFTGSELSAYNPVSIANGGQWHLTWNLVRPNSINENVPDTLGNSQATKQKIMVEVRRKFSSSPSDFPTIQDSVYKKDFGLTELQDETAWEEYFDAYNALRWRNQPAGRYANYLITATDLNGNKNLSADATFSLQVNSSCPKGYIGVSGFNGSPGAWNEASTHATLGTANSATTGIAQSNVQQNPTKPFCVMKYPSKVLSANTTAAEIRVGAKEEAIFSGWPKFHDEIYRFNQTTGGTLSWGTYQWEGSPTLNYPNGAIQYLPDSRATGMPWVDVTRNEAKSHCELLNVARLETLPNVNKSGFGLISNTQWQMLARNLENNPNNWSANAVGSGKLNRGFSNNTLGTTSIQQTKISPNINLSPWLPTHFSWCDSSFIGAPVNSNICNGGTDTNWGSGEFTLGAAAGEHDGKPYLGTSLWNDLNYDDENNWSASGVNPAAGREQKRTWQLLNGQNIWDFAGNVWQWVADDVSGLNLNSPPSNAGEFVTHSTFNGNSANKAILGPFGSSFATNQNLGHAFFNSGFTAIARGGYYKGGAANIGLEGAGPYPDRAGIFSFVTLNPDGSAGVDTKIQKQHIGFRCVYTPE